MQIQLKIKFKISISHKKEKGNCYLIMLLGISCAGHIEH